MSRTKCSKCGEHNERMIYKAITDRLKGAVIMVTYTVWLCGPCADTRESKKVSPAFLGLPSKQRLRTGWNGGVTGRSWTR